MLKLVEVTKDYPVAGSVVHALKGISVNFRKSEFVSVLGESGAGKSTTLKVVAGLVFAPEGFLYVHPPVERLTVDAFNHVAAFQRNLHLYAA